MNGAQRNRPLSASSLSSVAAVVLAATLACAVSSAADALPAGPASSRAALLAVKSAPARASATRRKGRCIAGHVELALVGPRLVSPQQPTAYVIVARACRAKRPRTLRHFRLSLLGPQRISWSISRLRSGGAVRRRLKLTFPSRALDLASTPVTLTLQARSRAGRLLRRRHVRVYLKPTRPSFPPDTVTAGWGTNRRGETGAGFRSDPLTSPVAGPLKGVRQVVSAYSSGFALLSDGTVRAWGGNEAGQLGDGTRAEKINPVPVQGLSHVVQIAASGFHAMALLENGTVFAWGTNFFGTLGNGTHDATTGEAHPLPAQVPGLGGVAAIAAGGGDSAAVLANGTVVAWGENKNGQLGDGTTERKLVPTAVKRLANVRAVALGGVSSLGTHMLALLRDGELMVSGQNDHGQLGLGDTADRLLPVPLPSLSNVTSVSASGSHNLAIVSGGALLSWGADTHGELGYAAPQMCEAAPCATTPRRVALAGVSAASAGFRFSVAVSNGQLLSWGYNEDGQLGDGTKVQSTAPVMVSGIVGVTTLSAGEHFTLATAAQVSSPDFYLIPAPGALLARWAELPGAEPWSLSWRPVSRPKVSWGKPVILPAAVHSFQITGLSPVPYEVRLSRVKSAFGYRVASATPG
jgi:alpha-tubulin suppressor-like RCC1 family protein